MGLHNADIATPIPNPNPIKKGLECVCMFVSPSGRGKVSVAEVKFRYCTMVLVGMWEGEDLEFSILYSICKSL